MRIAVNTRLLIKNKLEGIGWFTYESLKRIAINHPEHEFIFIFDRKYSEEFVFSDNVKPVVVPPQARHPFLYYLWFEFSIPYILKKERADVFLSPDGYLSLSTKVKMVQVIHDINFEFFPEYLPFLERKYYRYFFKRFAKKATRIATVSEHSKKDIVEQYNVDPSKIDVVYDGANEKFKPISDLEKENTKKKFSDGNEYFLFIGSLHPRKNVANLLKSFDKFKTTDKGNFKLLIVGEKFFLTKDIENAYNEMLFKDDVKFLGRLDDENLKWVVGAAYCMLYTSLFEGFGIPILEAMYAEIPVITSNTSSMPEVGGDAVLYADPYSVDSITSKIQEIASDENLRKKLIELGCVQREKYSWDKTAKKLWDCIDNALTQCK